MSFRIVLASLCLTLLVNEAQAGIIKDLFQKVTHTGNKTDNEPVKQAAPICGSGLFFASADQQALSPEMIFITSRPSETQDTFNRKKVNEVAKEFRFNVNNVTIEELEHYGFNRNAPVTILMHGFTSGYPLQAWMTGIVEAYTIERETQQAGGSNSGTTDSYSRPTSGSSGYNSNSNYGSSTSGYGNSGGYDGYGSSSSSNYNGRSTTRRPGQGSSSSSGYGYPSTYSNNNNNYRDRRETSSSESTRRRTNNNGRDLHYGSSYSNSSYGSGGRHNDRDDDRDTSSYGNSQYGGSNNNNNHGGNSNNGYGHSGNSNNHNNNNHGSNNHGGNSNHNDDDEYGSNSNHHGSNGGGNSNSRPQSFTPASTKVKHNLFIINWNYAAKGILYPRAVANIPIVASYGARFVNEKLMQDARINPKQIQLIGHSLGAHLAGFIGKNTKSKVGRIYGLDPAGPCFGAYAGFLYPKAQRLAPSDAEEVITIQTNGVLLGHDKPLGRYSVYVEGGEVQPGCKGGGLLKSLGAFTWDGADFDALACSHSRAPNLLMYNHQNRRKSDATSKIAECELVGYECSSWKDFTNGFCGVCSGSGSNYNEHSSSSSQKGNQPNEPVECVRLGLDWQYVDKIKPGQSSTGSGVASSSGSSSGYQNQNNNNYYNNDNDDNDNNNYSRSLLSSGNSTTNRSRNNNNSSSSSRRNRRFDRGYDRDVQPIQMFLRTSDTQPYCTYHYQIILELTEKFDSKDPPMSLLLQDSDTHKGGSSRSSLSTDEFGHRYSDLIYTHLLTSVQRVGLIEHATLLFRNGHKNGIRTLRSLQINYMSNIDPAVRKRLSTRLCPVQKDESQEGKPSTIENTRFFFEACDKQSGGGSQTLGNNQQGYRPSSNNSGSQSGSNSGYGHGSSSNGYGQSGSSSSGHNQSGHGHSGGNNSGFGYGHSGSNSGSGSSGYGHSGSNSNGYGHSSSNNGGHSGSNSGGYGSNSNYGREDNDESYRRRN